MGFYVLCPATAFAGTTALLSALVGQAARELSGRLPTMLVLHIDSISGALSLREVAAGGSLRPCEFKLAGLLDQMVQLQCRCDEESISLLRGIAVLPMLLTCHALPCPQHAAEWVGKRKVASVVLHLVAPPC